MYCTIQYMRRLIPQPSLNALRSSRRRAIVYTNRRYLYLYLSERKHTGMCTVQKCRWFLPTLTTRHGLFHVLMWWCIHWNALSSVWHLFVSQSGLTPFPQSYKRPWLKTRSTTIHYYSVVTTRVGVSGDSLQFNDIIDFDAYRYE